MNDKDISRRVFIQRLSLFGATGLGASALLSACGGGGQQQTETPAEAPMETAEESLSCTDTSGLTEPEVAMRNQLQYTDHSTMEGKTCSNCALFQPPAADGQCGACAVVKGPINPDGYCTSWAQKPA